MAERGTLMQLVFRNLERLERIVLAALIIIGAARFLGFLSTASPITFGLITLGTVYYLFAFRPPAPLPEGRQLDFMGLLITTILPKVLWISCSVGAVGLAFYFNGMPGAQQMLLIQASTGLVGLIIWGIGNLQQTESLDRVTAPMTRAFPILLIAVYILLK